MARRERVVRVDVVAAVVDAASIGRRVPVVQVEDRGRDGAAGTCFVSRSVFSHTGQYYLHNISDIQQ